MNKNNKSNKKSLYESIMRDVAKTVKKRINESYNFDDCTYNVNRLIQELPECSSKIELAKAIGELLKQLRDTISPVLDYEFNTNSIEKDSVIEFEHNIQQAIEDITEYGY